MIQSSHYVHGIDHIRLQHYDHESDMTPGHRVCCLTIFCYDGKSVCAKVDVSLFDMNRETVKGACVDLLREIAPEVLRDDHLDTEGEG